MKKTFELQMKFARMVLGQLGSQRLERTVEPDAVTAGADQVLQYEKVLHTKLVIAYALALETLHRVLPSRTIESRALDLACGPGHFALQLLKHLAFRSVEGADLSHRMIASATATAERLGFGDKAEFRTADIRDAKALADHSFDLTTFTDAAHHMPTIGDVQSVLREMNRITKPDGVIFLMDLVRLRTTSLTDFYVNTLGAEYVAQGLPAFFEDFRHSMYAAWTSDELRAAVPRETRRTWFHMVPRGLPTVQMLIGVPTGRDLFLRGGSSRFGNEIIPAELRFEWRLARASLAMARLSRLDLD